MKSKGSPLFFLPRLATGFQLPPLPRISTWHSGSVFEVLLAVHHCHLNEERSFESPKTGMNISPKKTFPTSCRCEGQWFFSVFYEKNHWLVRIPFSLYYFVGQMAQYFPDPTKRNKKVNWKWPSPPISRGAEHKNCWGNPPFFLNQLHQLSAGRVWGVQCATSMWRVWWKLRLLNLRGVFFMDILWWLYEHTHKYTSIYIYISSWWLNQPIWKIWSSNWIIFPNSDEHKTCPHPDTKTKCIYIYI